MAAVMDARRFACWLSVRNANQMFGTHQKVARIVDMRILTDMADVIPSVDGVEVGVTGEHPYNGIN